MKVLAIVGGIVLLVFVSIQIFGMISQKGIETYSYTVMAAYDDFEVRHYDASLFTSVKLSTGDYKQGSSKGFSVLAGYIFGGNEKKEKISMTSPVSMSLEDSMTMMFMVPKKYDKASLPQPDQSNINFKEEPAKKMAAIQFGGWADNDKIEKYKSKLIEALNEKNINHNGKFYFFGYNAPYEVFNRRNEVLVELPPNEDDKVKSM